MLGTPMTMRLPPCPPDANSRYSSFFPVGVYVLSAATASASLRPRALSSSPRLLPAAAPLPEPFGPSLQAPRRSGPADSDRASATLLFVFRMIISLHFSVRCRGRVPKTARFAVGDGSAVQSRTFSSSISTHDHRSKINKYVSNMRLLRTWSPLAENHECFRVVWRSRDFFAARSDCRGENQASSAHKEFL